jgi:hypothetical protein
MALKAVRLRTGSLVERIELVCFDPGITPISHAVASLPSFGGPGNSRSRTYFEQCPGRAVMMGVEANSGWAIDRLSATCQTVLRVRDGSLAQRGARLVVPGHGGAGGTWANRPSCFSVPDSSNSAMVGLRLSHNGQAITSVANICVDDMRSWGSGINVPAKRVVGDTGVVNGGTTDLICPVGKFVVGWRLKAGDSGGPVLVENLRVACRAL